MRVWSDGSNFSVEVDGDQVALFTDVDLAENPFKFHFGSNSHKSKFFAGMIKHLQLQSGSDLIFDLQVDKEIQVEDMTDMAKLVGIHKMRKARFQKEFRA